jgi:hypothetical protein
LQVYRHREQARSHRGIFVGRKSVVHADQLWASLLAMVVNDDERRLEERGDKLLA